MKRKAILWLILLCTALILLSCDNSTPPNGTVTDCGAVTDTQPEQTDISIDIVKDGVAQYRIVRGEEADQVVVDAAVMIREKIGSVTGVTPDIGTDWVRRGTDLDHTAFEILIGDTAYPESDKAMEDLPYGDYIITQVDNKLVINSRSKEGMNRAVAKFLNMLTLQGKEGNFSLPGDVRYTETAVEIVNCLPQYTDGDLLIIYPAGDRAQLLVCTDTTPEAYADYRKKLEAAGYVLHTETVITDNLFATYANDQYVVHAGYYAYEKAVRLTIEPRKALPALPADNQYTASIQPSVAMLGLEFEGKQNGLCLVFQLADGSYIIVDGGFNRTRDAQSLYEYMYAHAPDPSNITIAGWFITHSHSDHHGAFLSFCQNYGAQVTVEYVIANFPSTEARLEGGVNDGAGGSTIVSTAEKLRGTQFIKAHTGYIFHMRDAKIEILYTHESFAPRILSYYNTSSLIFTVDLAGQRFMVLGDASHDAGKIAQSMYGSYLKSDIIQTAHHGYTTGSTVYSGITGLYTKAAAPVVLWPLGDQTYPSMSSRAFSRHLQELSTTKEIFVAGSRDIRLMLPYTYGTSGYPSILN